MRESEDKNASWQLMLVKGTAYLGVLVELGLAVWLYLQAIQYGQVFDVNDCLAFIDGPEKKADTPETFQYPAAVALHFLKPWKMPKEEEGVTIKHEFCLKDANDINKMLKAGVPYFVNLGLKGYWPQFKGVGGGVAISCFLIILYLGALSGFWKVCLATDEEKEEAKREEADEIKNASWCDVWFYALGLSVLGVLGLVRVVLIMIVATTDPCGFKTVVASLNRCVSDDAVNAARSMGGCAPKTFQFLKYLKDITIAYEIPDVPSCLTGMGKDAINALCAKETPTEEDQKKIDAARSYFKLVEGIKRLQHNADEPANVKKFGFSQNGKTWMSKYYTLTSGAIDTELDVFKQWQEYKNPLYGATKDTIKIEYPGVMGCTFAFGPFWGILGLAFLYTSVGVYMMLAACGTFSKPADDTDEDLEADKKDVEDNESVKEES